MIVLKTPYLKVDKICCDFYENGIKRTFSIKTNSNITIDYKIMDAFVFSIVFYAILKKHDIKVEGTISSSFSKNLTDVIIPSLAQFFKREKINIDISKTLKVKLNSHNSCLCIDNFNVDTFVNLNKIKTNYLIYIDTNCTKKDSNKFIPKFQNFCTEFNYNCIVVENNFNDVLNVDKKYQKINKLFCYLASLFLFSKQISKFYLDYNTKEEIIELLNSINNPNLVKLKDLNNLDRIEKIKIIDQEKKSYSYLSECKKSKVAMCGKCDECRRLLLELDFFANINNYKIYNIKNYKKQKNHYIAFLLKNKLNYPYLYDYYKNNYHHNLKPYLINFKKNLTNKNLNIGLVYLDVSNFGDMVIYDSAKYLVKLVLKNLKIKNYNIVSIDIGDYNCRNYKVDEEIINKNNKIYQNEPDFIKDWKNSKNYNYFLENEYFKLKDLDLIIFVGGGLIKYSNQLYITMMIDEITKYAEVEKIPVIFNGVGIEGYDEKDMICQFLKKAINRESVTAITTRDDIDTLNYKYLSNKKIYTSLTFDSAIFTQETYNVAKNNNSDTIGLGVIRSNIYEEYSSKIDEEKLLKFYKEIIDKLQENKIKFKLFTNGGISDFKFIIKLKEYMQANDDFYDNVESATCNAYDLVKKISDFKLVVSCRLHGSIIAYSLGIPTIVLVWNHKQILFSKMINQESNFIQTKDFKSDIIIKKIKENINGNKLDLSKEKETAYQELEKPIKKSININKYKS